MWLECYANLYLGIRILHPSSPAHILRLEDKLIISCQKGTVYVV